MISLLVLLALVGVAETCDLTRSGQNGSLFTDLNVHPRVRIVEGNWPEARLVPHVAGILLRQVLGYNVEYKLDGGDGAGASRMYEMLANEEADLALTLWPAKFWNSVRSKALTESCHESSTDLCVATVGNQGYRARSGWFVSTNVSAVRGRVAEWSTVVNLYNHADQLVKAHELDVVNQCEILQHNLTEGRFGGKYNCTDGSWVFDNSSCCPRAMYAHLHNAASTADLNTTSEAFYTACDGLPPCVALMVDDPTYDAGLNEAIAARLAQPTRVMGEDDRFVGIQIVYGKVPSAMDKFTGQDKPLLAYSWLPRAEVIVDYARITLESFYHCGDEGKSTPLAKRIDREVTACDFPIEHVEKAVVWRLQQPSSTKAALFVNKFNLSAAQLNQLLEIGNDLSLARNSTPSEADLDRAACLWLNNNTDTWEAWLPDFGLYNTLPFQWHVWLIVCVSASLVAAVIGYLFLREYERAGEAYEILKNKKAEGNEAKMISSWPNKPDATKYRVVSCLGCLCCCKCINSETWKPVLQYLSNALRCLVNAEKSKYWSCCQEAPEDDWSFRWHLLLFGLGELFVGASAGLFEGLIYSTWLTSGLNQLSLEVTISCAAWMLTLRLFKWGFKSLPNGEKVVRRQLQMRLRMKREELRSKRKLDSEKEDRFKTAIDSAKTLAANCYSEAWYGFSEFVGFLSAIGFLFYYFFKEGPPEDMSWLFFFAFACAPTWLSIVLIFGPLLRKCSATVKAKVKAKVKKAKVKEEESSTRAEPTEGDDSAKDDEISYWSYKAAYGWILGTCVYMLWASAKDEETYPSYKRTYSGILWTCIYTLWAFGPILINPLKNKLGAGANFVPLPDLLTVLLVLTTMGQSLRDLEGNLSSMAKSSSMAAEVADLLKEGEAEPSVETAPSASASASLPDSNAEATGAEASRAKAEAKDKAKSYKEKAATSSD